MKLVPTLALFALLTSLAACNSLSPEECLMADWDLIGFEDGSQGYELSRIGQHRQACAAHGVTPDLSRYEAGFTRGVRTFCTWDKGFTRGSSGGNYHGQCPADLAGAFIDGYNSGLEIHHLNNNLRSLDSDMRRLDRDLNQLEKRIADKERQLVVDGTTPERRSALLREIELLRKEQLDSGIIFSEMLLQRDLLELDLQDLQAQY